MGAPQTGLSTKNSSSLVLFKISFKNGALEITEM